MEEEAVAQVGVYRLGSAQEPWDWVCWEDQVVEIGFRFGKERAPPNSQFPRLLPLGLSRRKRGADVPTHQMMTCLCVSGRVFGAIAKFLTKQDQVFPLKSDLGEYYAINVLRYVDCLDPRNCAAQWAEGEEFVNPYTIWKFAFRPGTVPRAAVFRIPEFHPDILITEPVAAAIRDSGAQGYRLDGPWPAADPVD